MGTGDNVTTPPALAGSTFTGSLKSKATELKNALIEQTINDMDSFAKAEKHQWELAHPDISVDYYHPTLDQSKLEEYRNTIRTSYYSWVEPAFQAYAEPDPDAVNPIIDSLRQMESDFGGSQDGADQFNGRSNSLTRLNDVRTAMGHWQGDLQTNFIDSFLTPLQTASFNQSAIAKVVREQLEGSKVVYIRRRKSVMDILDKGIDAAKSLKQGRDPGSYQWATLVGIAVGTALTIGSGGLAVAGAAIIIGSTLAQGLTPEGDKRELAAPTAQEVAVNISNALTKLDKDVSDEEDKVRAAFNNVGKPLAAALAANKSGKPYHKTYVAVPAPDIADAKPGDVTDGSLTPR